VTVQPKALDFTEKKQFPIPGSNIQVSLTEKIGFLDQDLVKLLDKIKEIPKDIEDSVMLIMTMAKDNAMDPRTVYARALAKQAALVHTEIEDMKRLQRAIMPNTTYNLTEEDLRRFGL